MNDESLVFSSPPPTASTNNDSTIELGRVLTRLRATNGVEMSVKVAMDFLQVKFERCPLIWLGLYDRRTHQITGKGGVLPTDNRRALRHSFCLKPGDTLERVVIQQEPIQIENLQREPNAGDWSEAARQAGIQSAVVWPISCRNQCLGVVVLGASRTGLTIERLEATQLTIVLGELGNVLYVRELEELRAQLQRPHAVMLSVAQHLQGEEPVGQRLAHAVEEVQRFLKPTQTRLYWIDRDRGLFVGHDLALALEQQGVPNWIDGDRGVLLSPDLLMVANAQGLPIAEFAGFHDRLLENQPVAIGEAYSSLSSAETGRLMARLQTRSLLAAPLWHHDDDGDRLLGFLAAEAQAARVWTRDERLFLHGVSRSIAIAAAGYRLSVSNRRLHECHTATLDLVKLGRKHASRSDERAIFIEIAERLRVGLNLQDVAVLQLDRTSDCFCVTYQQVRGGALPETLPVLGDIDERLLANGRHAIALSDIARSQRHGEHNIDIRLSPWQPVFVAAGWHALAVSSTASGALPEFAIAIGDAHAREWSERDLFLLQWAAQQLEARHSRQHLTERQDRTQSAIAAISRGLNDLQRHQSVEAAEREILQQVRALLDPECVALLHPIPESDSAHVTASLSSHDSHTAIAVGTTIENFHDEPLWQRSLEATGFIGPLAIATLPPPPRPWLGTETHGQIYALALRSDPQSEPNAVFLAIDRGDPWDESLLASVQVLLEALFQAGRVARLTQQLHEKRDALEPLNWYKHRKIESLYWTLGSAGRQIERLVNQLEVAKLNDPDIADEADRERLFGQQTLRVLGENLNGLKTHLQQEQWQLQFAIADLSLVTLLKHVLDRSNALLEKRQLWLQVHREGNAIVRGDRKKIELVFYELLTWACQRSPSGGRLDIWYRPLVLDTVPATTVLELTITDAGTIDPHLVAVFQRCIVERGGHSVESLTAPELDRAPGIHLAVYYALMKAMGGHFYLEQLEDGRTATRLLIPLAESEKPTPPDAK
ncbi:MAG: GAF domain-containing protein [Geitlerinemataceae cyanobacterium]